MSLFQQAFLLGLLGAYCHLDWAVGFLYCNRPIVLAPLAGLIMGDPQAGLALGAVLETYFLGSVVIGGYQAPDAGLSSILATAFAIKSGLDVDAALLIAVPVAVITTQLQNVLWSVYSITTKIADDFAAKGNDKGVYAIMWLECAGNALLKFLLVFLAWYIGSEQVVVLMQKIPAAILNGMTAAGGYLPAIGIAILMGMIINKKNAHFFVLGFVLASFFKVPTLAIAILGVVVVLCKFDFTSAINSLKDADVAGGNEDDF